MQPEQIEMVRACFAAVIPRSDELSAHFYERLFADDPETRKLFPESMDEQQAKLIDELAAIVDALDHLSDLVARTTDLGRRHVDYGTTPEHYQLAREALLGALGDVLGDSFTPGCYEAWRSGYDLVAETMMHGAAHGPTTGGTTAGRPANDWRTSRS